MSLPAKKALNSAFAKQSPATTGKKLDKTKLQANMIFELYQQNLKSPLSLEVVFTSTRSKGLLVDFGFGLLDTRDRQTSRILSGSSAIFIKVQQLFLWSAGLR